MITLLFGCQPAEQEKQDEVLDLSDGDTPVRELLDKYTTVQLTADLDHLTENQK